MITEEELKKTEDEVYIILKSLVPFYVEKAIEDAAQDGQSSFSWVKEIDKIYLIGLQLDKLLEIA
jgi:hypothetical protein